MGWAPIGGPGPTLDGPNSYPLCALLQLLVMCLSMVQGAERPVRLPQDLERFQHLPMLVTFQLEDSSKYAALLLLQPHLGSGNAAMHMCVDCSQLVKQVVIAASSILLDGHVQGACVKVTCALTADCKRPGLRTSLYVRTASTVP